MLEPAAHAKPVLVGTTYVQFQRQLTRFLPQCGACLTVEDSAELAPAAIIDLLSDSEKCNQMGDQARAVIVENRGASARSAICIKEIVENHGATP